MEKTRQRTEGRSEFNLGLLATQSRSTLNNLQPSTFNLQPSTTFNLQQPSTFNNRRTTTR
ncbi:MAG: hypothetical protein F6K44_30655 [Moorea sp. SIO3E2]|nr:hypothetical protein [Moorena sp. SIO3E2]